MSNSNLDPVALTAALVRCQSVTPDEGGALTLLESILQPAGFACHRLMMTEAGTPLPQRRPAPERRSWR